MNAILVTYNEPFCMPRYIERVLETHSAHVRAVVALPGASSFWTNVRYHFDLFGPVLFVYTGVHFVFFKLFDVVARVVPLGRPYSVAAAAAAAGVPYHEVDRINSKASHELLAAYNPDVVLSIAAPQKFNAELLSLPRVGCFNIHSSLLPRYAGINALFWALLHGEDETGVTLHKMIQGIDSGPIVVQRAFTIEPDDFVFSLYEKAMETGSDAARDFLDLAQVDRIPMRQMLHLNPAHYFSFPTGADRQALYRSGRRYYRYL